MDESTRTNTVKIHEKYLPESNVVKTLAGWKYARDVKEEEKVFTTTGFRIVTQVRQRELRRDESFYFVEPKGMLPVVMPSMYSCFAANAFLNTKVADSTHPNKKVVDYEEPQLVSVSMLSKDHGVVYKVDKTLISHTVDLLQYVSQDYRDVNGYLVNYITTQRKDGSLSSYPRGRQNIVPRLLPVDFEFGIVIGFYAAQGSCNKNQVYFTNHVDIVGIREFVIDWFRRHGCKPSEKLKKGSNTMNLCITSLPFREFFRPFSSNRNKKYPGWVEFLPIDVQRGILIGDVLGDGTFTDGELRIDTVSKIRAFQLREMLARCGYNPRLKYTDSIHGRAKANGRSYGGDYHISIPSKDAKDFADKIPNDLKKGKKFVWRTEKPGEPKSRRKEDSIFYRVTKAAPVDLFSHFSSPGCLVELAVEDSSAIYMDGVALSPQMVDTESQVAGQSSYRMTASYSQA